MKDIFEQNSVRPNNQLLDPTASVPNGHSLDDAENEGLKFDEHKELDDEAEGMIHYLMVQSKKPAIMVDTGWTEVGESYSFAKKQSFVDATQNSPCVVHEMTCPDQGGTRHLLFIGKSADLADADYLECLPSSLPHLC